jgi:ankyrin repeat protein
MDMSESEGTLSKEFFEAILSGELQSVRKLLERDRGLIRAYDADRFNASAMNAGACSGKTEMVDLLIEFGASPDDGSDWEPGSFSPLITAINNNDLAMTTHLISRGATVTTYEAAAMGDVGKLNALLEENPESVNMRGGDGQTPLHVAANRETAQLLLDRGANLETKDVDHESTPLQYALNRPDVAELLLERGAKGDPFLYAALSNPKYLREAISSEPSVVHLRLTRDLFPTSPEFLVIYAFTIGFGCTPLHVAAQSNQLRNIELLVAAGANINERGGYDDSTPLHMAAWYDKADAIRVLARLGADLEIKSGEIHNTTPIVWAIVGGSENAMRSLLEAGAEVTEDVRSAAKAGAEGAFSRVKRVSPEARERILDMIS